MLFSLVILIGVLAQSFTVGDSAYFQKFGFSDHFGWEVGFVVVVGETLCAHVVEGSLFEQKAFVSAANADFAIENKVKVFIRYTSGIYDWVYHFREFVIL